jgi:Xaa-Pro aminopeptidase
MTLYPADRLARAADAAARAGLDALLVTPGADLRYLTGYDALQLERLTCLVVPRSGPATLVVPTLEHPRAVASPAGALGIDVVGWDETDDPYAITARLVGPDATKVGLSDRTWVMHGLRWRDALPGDDVQAQIQTWRRAGRTEEQVGRDVADAIVAGGNARVNFTIVGSGPNGASPHHDTGPRVIERGDAVVFDIGGTTPDGYCSDITRTYVVGDVPDGFDKLYAVLQEAQAAACDAVRPGITAEALDAVARDAIADAGYGEYFVHRTGHGIGLEEHEDPYIVSGNAETIEPGMAFSIEPGIYLPGRYGARIEDIVVCTDDGGERLNLVTRDLLVLDA